ncbi:calcium:proton antiporter [Pelomonas aquatica]|jgi:Ca2+:H+ antiporter|uniref:Ionic transporter y4hA n=1 Tax=Pelomonas aquatica TaxID=431058 RepID=A0A9X4LHB7_9BURK|nr:ionic transporter y4hA [Pelomonas aquatica]MCY4755733.1 ionic transporter y4hA [Pelomonas aquatica]MDG0862719.1 ionic transporter y4hA [Pelomonas aquatica]
MMMLVAPLGAMAMLVAALVLPGSGWLALVCAVALVAAVLSAVHHAEVIAHRLGEPFGTLVLALAVTVIEVALILSMMLAGGGDKATLPRDTIFSTLMIICNGVVGLCLLIGGLRHREQVFRVEGASVSLTTLMALAALTLVLPRFTTSTQTPTYSPSQLAFAASMALLLWLLFIFVQTVRHRDYFLPASGTGSEDAHAEPPSRARTWLSLGLLPLALVSVVGLAKVLSPRIEAVLADVGAPPAVLGIAIAMLVLLPETLAAVLAARANRLQISLNLAYGSALASIGLTIPAVAAASLLLGLPLVLGADSKELVLMLLTFLVSTLTLGLGRTHAMQGAVHLVIFAAYLFLAMVP